MSYDFLSTSCCKFVGTFKNPLLEYRVDCRFKFSKNDFRGWGGGGQNGELSFYIGILREKSSQKLFGQKSLILSVSILG